jgi:hypothetical protein
MLGLLFLPATAGGQTYVVKSGDTLQKIAAEFYGSETYDSMIVKHNNLPSTKAPIDGKSLMVPELNELLFREGLNRNVQSDIDLILKARYTYMVHRNELLKAITPGNSKGKIVVPLAIRNDLMEAAKNIETAAKNIAQKGNWFDAPVRMRRDLMTVAANIRKMARGKYKKDYDESVHKKLSSAFYFGIVWARDEDGNYHKLAH